MSPPINRDINGMLEKGRNNKERISKSCVGIARTAEPITENKEISFVKTQVTAIR